MFGKIEKMIPNRIGIETHTHGVYLYGITAPTIYANKMPLFRENVRMLPRLPRILKQSKKNAFLNFNHWQKYWEKNIRVSRINLIFLWLVWQNAEWEKRIFFSVFLPFLYFLSSVLFYTDNIFYGYYQFQKHIHCHLLIVGYFRNV